jgi:hypothetical protein
MENKPIQFTIENKNGIYQYSTKFKKKINISCIRLHVKDTEETLDNDKCISPHLVVTKFLVNGDNINLNDYFSAYGFSSRVCDLPITISLNSIDDLTFELIENSKIEVTLFPAQKINTSRMLGLDDLRKYDAPKLTNKEN